MTELPEKGPTFPKINTEVDHYILQIEDIELEEVNGLKTSGMMALMAALFVLATAAPAAGMYQGVSGGPSMSYAGVSGSIDGIFASYPEAPSFPAPCFMTGEEFCAMVAGHLSNPPKAWDW